MVELNFKNFGSDKKKMNLGICKELIRLTNLSNSVKGLERIVEYIYYGFLTEQLCKKLRKFTDSAYHITLMSRDGEQMIGLGLWNNWGSFYSFSYHNIDLEDDETDFREKLSEVRTQLTLILQFLTDMRKKGSLDDWIDHYS